MMSEEIIVKDFNNTSIEFMKKEDDIWVTARTLGIALEYSLPRRAIIKIFNRHRKELEAYSLEVTLGSGSDSHPVRIFNEKGTILITLFSRKPKAEEFRDWLSDVAIEIRKKGYYIEPSREGQLDQLMRNQLLLKNIQYKQMNQEEKMDLILKNQAEIKEKIREIEENKQIMDDTLRQITDMVHRIKNAYGKFIWTELKTKFQYSSLKRMQDIKGKMMILYMEKRYPLSKSTQKQLPL